MIAVQPQVQELWIKAQNKECITKGTRKKTEEQAERKKKGRRFQRGTAVRNQQRC